MIRGTVSRADLIEALEAQVVVWRDEAVPGTPPARAQWRLFVNDLTPTPETTLAEFTEPTGAWYVPANHVADYGQPYVGDDDTVRVAIPGTVYNFDPAGPVGPFQVYGAFVYTPTDTDWAFAVRFPAPVTLATALDSLPIDTVELVFPNVRQP